MRSFLALIMVFLIIPALSLGQVIIIDDNDSGYSEPAGEWFDSDAHFPGIGVASRWHRRPDPSTGIVTPGATARWTPDITEAGYYNVYYGLPRVINGNADALYVVSYVGGEPDSVRFNQNNYGNQWVYVGTYYFAAGQSGYLETINDRDEFYLGYSHRADVAKFEKVPSGKKAFIQDLDYDYAEIVIGEPVMHTFKLYNLGEQTLQINNVTTENPVFDVVSPTTFPRSVNGRGNYQEITIKFDPQFGFIYRDTLKIATDDPDNTMLYVALSGTGIGSFLIVDDEDSPPAYQEFGEGWVDGHASFIGNRSRACWSGGDQFAVYTPQIPTSAYYNVYYSVIATGNAATNALYIIQPFGSAADSVRVDQNGIGADPPSIGAPGWKYLGVWYFVDIPDGNYIVAQNDQYAGGTIFRVDAIKWNQIVDAPDIDLPIVSYDFGELVVDENESKTVELTIKSTGALELTIDSLVTTDDHFVVESPVTPVVIPSLEKQIVVVRFTPTDYKNYNATLRIVTNDPDESKVTIDLLGTGVPKKFIVDNTDAGYTESPWPGITDTTWFTSSYAGYGEDSRIVWLREPDGPNRGLYRPFALDVWAKWTPDITESGLYDIAIILPATRNSASGASYIIHPFGSAEDTVVFNQNQSGGWFQLGNPDGYYFQAGTENFVKVIVDTSQFLADTSVNWVLRADAFRFSKHVETSVSWRNSPSQPTICSLEQNYPNPFNPETSIKYYIPHDVHVTIMIFNILGQHVTTLIDEKQLAGTYTIRWDGCDITGSPVSSGTYIYQMKANNFVSSKKMLILK